MEVWYTQRMNFGLTTIYLIRHGDEKNLIKKFEDIEIAAIYSSVSPEAKNVASKIADKKTLKIHEEKSLKKPTIKTLEKNFEKLITFMQKVAREHEDQTIVIITHGQFLRKFLIKFKYGTEKEFAPGSVESGGYLKLESNGHDFFATETHGVKIIEEASSD